MAEIAVEQLRPGMVLIQDVKGVSGRPIVRKGTELTEQEIEFLKAFLIERVHVSMSTEKVQYTSADDGQKPKEENEQESSKQLDDSFVTVYEEVVVQFKLLFRSWQANAPVKMYSIRELCLPLFELVESKELDDITSLLQGRKSDLFYYKTVAVSLLSIKLAQLMNYKKKDWLQIGFASLLADAGLAKTEVTIDSSQADRKHPIRSYEMIKNEPTLTDHAKLAIVQHHERLDGSGFPMQLQADKIHPYAQLIAVNDSYFTLLLEFGEEVYEYWKREKAKLATDLINLFTRG